ncbi:nucleopolyhedrovirus P10 family protein [Streptomyces sp. V3I7]|uniref:nucleopolyhedrovirus P10 family protein n=1 Tax=Streptomyces sp. V3I7 TaxID=3042278 RepID=UPI002783C2AE|nr:nucleopolyhedrovirus P10 family protein [Streptomyces sp. V3I7]MDQ0990151.1 hypothetical protein [Streptomyces sp. V3I7]
MTADRWTQAVRDQLALGRVLPLGGPRDGAWITEGAAEAVLRRAVAAVPGVRLGALRIGLADPEDVSDPVVPAPPSALPPGPLRLTADFAATAAEPLPAAANRLRTALSTAADELLGLTVAEVDLRVTELLDEQTQPEAVRSPEPPRAREATTPYETRAAEVALGVPGVTHLTGTLGGLGRAVHVEDTWRTETALPSRHVRVEVAVSGDRRAVDVARQIRAALTDTLDDRPTAAVLVTTVS